MKVESRCGLLCGGCEFRESMGCAGCVHIEKPFHGACPVKDCCEGKGLVHCGQCPEFPCEQLRLYACDPEHGDKGQRLVQCGLWQAEHRGRFSGKGYFVKENAPIYMTPDMDRTAKWFEEVLGWYSNIVERTPDGRGCYGVVFDMPPEVERTHLAPFTGMQMFLGEPEPRVLSFMQVRGIEEMRRYVLSNGWEQITEVALQPWGGKTCELTTIDGYTIKVFE